MLFRSGTTKLFSFKAETHPSKRIFTFRFDPSGNIVDENIIEFPLSVLNQFVSERTQKKNEDKDDDDKSEFSNLVLRKFIVQEDGSFILVGEQAYVVERTRTDSKGMTHTSYTYYYNDMLMAKIDNTGKLAWMKKLPKRQKGSRGKGGMSFAYFNGGGKHYVVFLDNVKNKNLPINKVPEQHSDGRGGFLTAYRVDDASGQTKKYSFFDVDDYKDMEFDQFTAKRVLSCGPNEFAVEFYKKKKEDVYVKVSIP